MKKFKGNPPPGITPATVLVLTTGERWIVYLTPGTWWTSVKLIADKPAEKKTNYWLGWNGTRMAQGQSQKKLDQYRPELAAALELWLLNHHGKE